MSRINGYAVATLLSAAAGVISIVNDIPGIPLIAGALFGHCIAALFILTSTRK